MAGILGKYTETTTILGLFFVAIFVVYADERTWKCEDFAKSDEDRVMDFADGLYYKARHKHYAPEGT